MKFRSVAIIIILLFTASFALAEQSLEDLITSARNQDPASQYKLGSTYAKNKDFVEAM